MKLFLGLLGDSILTAVVLVGAISINMVLAQEKNAICYIGMVMVDVIAVASVCACLLRLFGIIG